VTQDQDKFYEYGTESEDPGIQRSWTGHQREWDMGGKFRVGINGGPNSGFFGGYSRDPSDDSIGILQ